MWACVCKEGAGEMLVVGTGRRDGYMAAYMMQSGKRLWIRSSDAIAGLYVKQTDCLVTLFEQGAHIDRLYAGGTSNQVTFDHKETVIARHMYVDAHIEPVVHVITNVGVFHVQTWSTRSGSIEPGDFSRPNEDGVPTERVRMEGANLVRTLTFPRKRLALAEDTVLLGLCKEQDSYLISRLKNTPGVPYAHRYATVIKVDWYAKPPRCTEHESGISFVVTALTADHIYYTESPGSSIAVQSYDLRASPMHKGSGMSVKHFSYVGPTWDKTRIILICDPTSTTDPDAIFKDTRYLLHPVAEVDTDELFGDIKNAAKTS